MTIYSLVSKTVEHGGWTGVCRFDMMLRRVFPGLVSVSGSCPELGPRDLVITDNHLSLKVPPEVSTLVVNHGCASTHYDRDPQWRTAAARQLVDWQRRMFRLPNRHWIAPSAWVAEAFEQIAPGRRTEVIPHWVDPIDPLPKAGKPKIIGDWRDWNKGADHWRHLAEQCPDWDFRPLDFRDDAGKRRQYGEASLYLCLSVSEGGSYAMCDAEAAGLPIVTTDVGNYREFADCEVIPWRKRGDLELVTAAIKRKLEQGRRQPSYYSSYSIQDWAERWRAVVADAGGVEGVDHPVRHFAVGLASGLGNAIMMLPTIKALKQLGHQITVYSQTDWDTADLWRRCQYIDDVLEAPAGLNGHLPICGMWRPEAWRQLRNVIRYECRPPYTRSEWQSNFRLAERFGWQDAVPDVSDWCRDLDRTPRWDVGIVPGCKVGIWLRKRWPGMRAVADHFLAKGLRVAVFGLDCDGVADIPGERIVTDRLVQLPDQLAGCRVIVGTDSGVTQLASSLGIPVAMILTASCGTKSDPVGSVKIKISRADLNCRPCVSTPRWQACSDWKCRDVEAASVIRAAEDLLEERNG